MLGINSIVITPAILNQISDIDEFKGLWSALDKHTTGLHLLDDVADYGTKFSSIAEPLKDQPLSPKIIAYLHGILTGTKNQSAYRKNDLNLPVPDANTPAGEIHTAHPDDIAQLLEKLCEWVNDSLDQKTLHPLLVVSVFISVFLQIAPFEQGNMRIARFLLVLILLKANYMYAPYASLSSIIQDHALSFFEALRNNQESLETGKADWNEWLNAFLAILQTQKNILHTRLYDKKTEMSNLPALSSRIMALFKEHKRLQMNEIIKLTNGRRATIKLRLSELLDQGYLKRHGQGRATWYSLV